MTSPRVTMSHSIHPTRQELRNHLNKLKYELPLSEESFPLVNILLHDLLKSVDNYQIINKRYEELQNERRKLCDENSALRSENTRLTNANCELRRKRNQTSSRRSFTNSFSDKPLHKTMSSSMPLISNVGRTQPDENRFDRWHRFCNEASVSDVENYLQNYGNSADSENQRLNLSINRGNTKNRVSQSHVKRSNQGDVFDFNSPIFRSKSFTQQISSRFSDQPSPFNLNDIEMERKKSDGLSLNETQYKSMRLQNHYLSEIAEKNKATLEHATRKILTLEGQIITLSDEKANATSRCKQLEHMLLNFQNISKEKDKSLRAATEYSAACQLEKIKLETQLAELRKQHDLAKAEVDLLDYRREDSIKLLNLKEKQLIENQTRVNKLAEALQSAGSTRQALVNEIRLRGEQLKNHIFEISDLKQTTKAEKDAVEKCVAQTRKLQTKICELEIEKEEIETALKLKSEKVQYLRRESEHCKDKLDSIINELNELKCIISKNEGLVSVENLRFHSRQHAGSRNDLCQDFDLTVESIKQIKGSIKTLLEKRSSLKSMDQDAQVFDRNKHDGSTATHNPRGSRNQIDHDTDSQMSHTGVINNDTANVSETKATDRVKQLERMLIYQRQQYKDLQQTHDSVSETILGFEK